MPNPIIEWDSAAWRFRVVLPINDGEVEASWNMGLVYIVRIREKGTSSWSPGFETPHTSISVSDLKPGTTYELELRAKNKVGLSQPSYAEARTLDDGTFHLFGNFPPMN